jgi:nicotinate-nucleotide adenylyltransferase
MSEEGRELFLLCGTDMILTLDSWYCPDEIFRLCTPVCVRRENDEVTRRELEEKLKLYKERYGVTVPVIEVEATELSSSEIRGTLKKGGSVSGLVTPEAEKFIETEGMYR